MARISSLVPRLLPAFFVAGCAIFASKEEYWLYRSTVEAQDLEERARLYKEYVEKYPSGSYAQRMREVGQEVEFALYNATGEDKVKIQGYLEIFPNGRFAADAKDKLAQLEAIERLKKAEAEALKKKMEEQAAEAERKRLKFTSEITGALADWAGIFSGAFTYGMRVPELANVSERFKELWTGEPLVDCGVEVCTKVYEMPYYYKVIGGTRIDRVIRMVVKVKFREGGILGVSVNFPGRGFLGLRELIEGAPRNTTKEEIDESAAFAVDLLRTTLASLLPSGKQVEQTPYLFAFESAGANFFLVRKERGEAGVIDSLVIQLLPPPAPASPVGAEKGKSKKGKKAPAPPPPPPPVASVEDLIYMPALPVASSSPGHPTPQPPALPAAPPAAAPEGPAAPTPEAPPPIDAPHSPPAAEPPRS